MRLLCVAETQQRIGNRITLFFDSSALIKLI